MALIFPIPSVTQCPVYNLYDSLVWKEILSDDEHSDTLAHAEISRLMQLLAQRDVKLSQKNAELAQKEIEISFYDAELARKDIELDQKNAELDRKDAELAQKNAELDRKDAELDQKDAELAQLLSQRDEESARNAVVINDVAQELLSVKQELAQRDAELVQERMCLRDRTLPAPIDVQVKLDEMFKSWRDDTSGSTGYIITYLLPLLLPKIRAATEQIKEPIMGLFHVTYVEIMNGYTAMHTDAMLFTATDVYYLTNSEYGSTSQDTRKVIIEYTPRWNSPRYTFTDPKWVKWTVINKDANFKKIITYIYQYSGHTGKDYQSNPNGMNNVYVKSGSETASARRQQLIAVAL
jgi:hypothetical protein